MGYSPDSFASYLAGGYREGVVVGRGPITKAAGKVVLERETGGNSAIRETPAPQPQMPEVTQSDSKRPIRFDIRP